MTCECGAQQCYLCRKPVHNGYNHFYGQGGSPKAGRNCPLFTNNSEVHDNDVAKGAREAKAKMDQENPTVTLKYDPTADIKMPKDTTDQSEQRGDRLLDGLLPADPRERERFVQQQQQLLENIRRNNQPNIRPHHEAYANRGRHPNLHHINRIINQGNQNDHHNGNLINIPDAWDAAQGQPQDRRHRHGVNDQGPLLNQYAPFPRPPFEANVHAQPQYPQLPPHPHPGVGLANPHPYPGDYNGFVDRMGELLQLREAQRQRQRAIRRREQQALEAFQIHRIATNNEANQPQLHNQVTGNQTRPHNRQQEVPNQLNAVPVNNVKHTNVRPTGAAVATFNQPQMVNPMHHTNQYNNTATNPNPLLVPPSLHIQDHHYAYHQRIQRHLNPVPNPIQPPPNVGSYRGNGPPPPAHPVVPHTVDLPPLPPVTNALFSHRNSLPPPAHPQHVHHTNTSAPASNVPNMAITAGSSFMNKPKSQRQKNHNIQDKSIPIGTNVYPPSTSGAQLNNTPRADLKHSGSTNTNIITATSQTLGKSKSNPS